LKQDNTEIRLLAALFLGQRKHLPHHQCALEQLPKEIT